MVYNLDVYNYFVELSKTDVRRVQLPNSETTVITHLGSSSILDSLVVKNVLYVPKFRYNLISISKLTKDARLFISFFPNYCLFQDICSGKVKRIGRLEHDLYVLDMVVQANYLGKLWVNGITSTLVVNKINGMICHRRLGHVHVDNMKRFPMLSNAMIADCTDHCDVCPLANKVVFPFLFVEIKVMFWRTYSCRCMGSF